MQLIDDAQFKMAAISGFVGIFVMFILASI